MAQDRTLVDASSTTGEAVDYDKMLEVFQNGIEQHQDNIIKLTLEALEGDKGITETSPSMETRFLTPAGSTRPKTNDYDYSAVSSRGVKGPKKGEVATILQALMENSTQNQITVGGSRFMKDQAKFSMESYWEKRKKRQPGADGDRTRQLSERGDKIMAAVALAGDAVKGVSGQIGAELSAIRSLELSSAYLHRRMQLGPTHNLNYDAEILPPEVVIGVKNGHQIVENILHDDADPSGLHGNALLSGMKYQTDPQHHGAGAPPPPKVNAPGSSGPS